MEILQLGKAIKVCRVRNGMKQKELAVEIGKSSNYLSLIEGGHRTPSLGVIEMICSKLGISINKLIKEAEATEDE